MGQPILAEGLDLYLAAVRRSPGPTPSLETARLVMDSEAGRLACPRPEGMTVSDTYVVGKAIEIPVRVYRPCGDAALPAIVYFHGGGFTIGSIESHDVLAAGLAEATGACVLSVQYARLPEATPYEISEQCYAALLWMNRMANALGIDSARLAVAGDSAGAFLATHVALLARDRAGPAIACQLLCYGVYDLDPDRAAYATARDPVLTRPVIDAMIATHRDRNGHGEMEVAAPLRIRDLSGLPPAILLGAEHDAVLAEACEYAARLRDAGVATEERIAPGMCHGFLRALRFSPPACDEMRWLGAAFRKHI